MCIIVYKPQGIAYPTEETLERCFLANPDGAGYMYADGGRVHIRKGYMTFIEFDKALNATRREIGDSAPVVLHFRISTQAGLRKDCTHPFPLSRKMDDLRKLKTAARIGVAHNGIIGLTSTYAKGVTHSDTMRFITDYMSLIIKREGDLRDADRRLLIERLVDGSRLAIMDAKGVELIGGGWIEDGGVYYSNASYREARACVPYAWECDYDPDFDEYCGEDWERYYDGDRGEYDFDALDCPVMRENNCDYCALCRYYAKCYLGGGE